MANIPPPPPGYTLDSSAPPPPPGFTIDPPVEGGLSRMDGATQTAKPKPYKPSVLEHIAYSTPVQAVTDIPVSLTQMILQTPGVPEKVRTKFQNWVNERERLYQQNPENQNFVGDINRGIIATATGAALVPGASQAGIMAQGAAGAMLQPVTGRPEDVPKGKMTQGALGAGTAGVLKVASKGAGKALEVGKRIFSRGESFAPEAVLAKFKGKVDGKASDVLQNDLAEQYHAARMRGGKGFEELRTQDGTISMNPYVAKIDEAMDAVNKSGFSKKETILKELQSLRDVATEGPVTWGKAMDMGTDINDQISQAMHGEKPNRNLARILEGVKKAHTESMDMAGEQFGDAYRQAKADWIKEVVPWEDPKQGGKLIQNFIKSPTPDQAMSALLKAKSEDKIGVFVSKLSPKGMDALQAGLVDNVYQQSLDEGGKVIPTKFLGALKARQDAYGLAFKGEAKWRMDGLAQLLRDARFTAKLMTGEWLRHVPGGRVLPGSAFPTPDAGSSLQKLFTSRQISKLLIRAQGVQPGSPAMGKIIDQISARAGAVAGEAKNGNVVPLIPTSESAPGMVADDDMNTPPLATLY